MTTTTRRCASCGARFPWSSQHPNRRFCNTRCRTRSWRARSSGNDPAGYVALAPPGLGTEVFLPPAPGLGAAAACPSCHQPIAVINIVMPLEPAE